MLPVFKFSFCFITEHLTKFKIVSQKLSKVWFIMHLFHLYIYLSDSQESDGGVIHRASNYPDLLPEMPRLFSALKFIQEKLAFE